MTEIGCTQVCGEKKVGKSAERTSRRIPFRRDADEVFRSRHFRIREDQSAEKIRQRDIATGIPGMEL